MCTDFGLDRLRFAGLIPERVKKSQYNIGFQPTIIITATTGWRSTWITSSVPGWTAPRGRPRRGRHSNNQRERTTTSRVGTRVDQQQSQPWSAEHVSAAVPSPRGSRPRKHWCPSVVKFGHLSVAAEKVYTTPQPPVHDVGQVRCGPPPPHCVLACREAHVNSYL